MTLPDGRSLHWCEYGAADGLPIFQFHGTPGSRLLGLDSGEVASAGLRVVTPERPGYGRSSAHPGARLADHVSDVAAVADALGISRFHVLGVSGGGLVALACAAGLPQRVLSATVVAGPAPADGPGFWAGLSLTNRALFAVARYLPALLPGVCAALALLMRDRPGQPPTHQGEAFRQGGAGLAADLRMLTRAWDVPLAAIRAPVFWWHGERDRLASPAGARALVARLPTCEVHWVPGAGHFIGRDPALAERMLGRIREVGRG